MKQALLAFTLLFSTFYCTAQGWEWAEGETCGNYLVDGYLCKSDKWNNVYAGGISQSDSVCFNQFEFHNPHGNSQIILTKYDSAGAIKWAIASGGGQAWPIQITTDVNGYLYLLADFWTDSITIDNHVLINPYGNLSPIHSCYFITKFDTSGHVIWAKVGANIVLTVGLTSGGIGVDDSSNVFVCGTFRDSSINIGPYTLVNTNDSTHDIFVAKYDSSGNVTWAKKFGSDKNDQVLAMAVSNLGQLYLTGIFYSQNIAFGSTTLHDSIATAFNYPDFFVAALNPSGDATWAKSSIGSALPYAICLDHHDGVYITGEVYDTASLVFAPFSFTDPWLEKSAFLVKYDTAGSVDWARVFSPISPENPSSEKNVFWGLTTDPCDNVWFSGVMTRDSMHLDSNTVVHEQGGAPTIIAGYSSSGQLVQYITIPIVEDDNSSLSSDNFGNLYLCAMLVESS